MTPDTGKFMLDQHWPKTLRDYGVEAADLLAHAGLRNDLFTASQVRLGQEEYFQLWRSFARFSPEPAFALLLGRQVEYVAFDPAVFAWICCGNIAEAVDRLARYYPVRGPMRLEVERLEDGIGVRWSGLAADPPGSLLMTELVGLVQMARMATRRQLAPRRLISSVRIPDRHLFEIYLGAPIEDGDFTGLEFEGTDLKLPFLVSGHAMWQAFAPELRRRLPDAGPGAPMADMVRCCMTGGIAAGKMTTAEEVAEQLSQPARTVQRRLRAEGTSFRTELTTVREGLGRHYLAKTDLWPAQIAYLLGFESAGSFERAFTAWTGRTPEGFRASGD